MAVWDRVVDVVIAGHKLKRLLPMLSMKPGEPPPAWVACAPTIRELALRIGIDANALAASVARFNEHAARGEDPDFRRHEIGFQRIAKPRPLDAAPYALAIWPGALRTNGGPRIDAEARVARAGGGVVLASTPPATPPRTPSAGPTRAAAARSATA